MKIDREKVIKGLECHVNLKCNDCPYVDAIHPGWGCHLEELIADALSLLKEQEAVKPYQFEDIWKCGNCGDGVVAYEELGVSEIEEVKFDYCPTCGRRVLWEGR